MGEGSSRAKVMYKGKAWVIIKQNGNQAIDKLFPEILEQLQPNVKILCYRFCIRGMTPDKVNADKTLFLYTLNKGTRVDQFR